METKHTEGKWEIYQPKDQNYLVVKSDNKDLHICEILKGTYTIDKKEARANTKLIAAAPDLLNSLDNFVRCIDTCTSEEGRKYMQKGKLAVYDSLKNSLTYQKATEAISKATE